MNKPKISIVAAMSSNGVIGNNGSLPWGRIPKDMERFRKITLGKTVIMGRKTHESIGRALPDRNNIVLSRLWSYNPIDCDTSPSLQHALTLAQCKDEVVVIGGAEVYKQVLEMNRVIWLYLTIVNADVKGDVYFPDLEREYYHIIAKERVMGESAEIPYTLDFVDGYFDGRAKNRPSHQNISKEGGVF